MLSLRVYIHIIWFNYLILGKKMFFFFSVPQMYVPSILFFIITIFQEKKKKEKKEKNTVTQLVFSLNGMKWVCPFKCLLLLPYQTMILLFNFTDPALDIRVSFPLKKISNLGQYCVTFSPRNRLNIFLGTACL